MSDLDGNPKDRFSHDEAQIKHNREDKCDVNCEPILFLSYLFSHFDDGMSICNIEFSH